MHASLATPWIESKKHLKKRNSNLLTQAADETSNNDVEGARSQQQKRASLTPSMSKKKCSREGKWKLIIIFINCQLEVDSFAGVRAHRERVGSRISWKRPQALTGFSETAVAWVHKQTDHSKPVTNELALDVQKQTKAQRGLRKWLISRETKIAELVNC